jgi:hypothetical protein
MFELSMNGTLQQNVILSGSLEPANGGTFIITPTEGDFEKLLSIIRDKESRASKLPYPHWDEHYGWGQSYRER